MDNNFKQLIRQHHNSTWISNSLSHTTTSNYKPNVNSSLFSRTITPYRPSNSRLVTEVSNRESVTRASPGNPKLLQLNVCHSQEGRGHPSRLQPQEIEPVLGSSTFQDGDNQGSLTINQSERLPCFSRFIRCFPSYRAPPGIKTLLTAQMKESSIPILYDSFRIGNKSLCVHQSLQAHIRALPISRLQDLRLLGRLDSGSKHKAIGPPTRSGSCSSSSTTRMDCESEEIGVNPHSITRTPRLLIEYSDNDSSSSSEEAPRHSSLYQTSVGQTYSTIPSCDTQSNNEDTSSNLCHLLSTSLHSASPVLQEPGGEIGSRLGQVPTSEPSKQGRIDLVVRQPEEVEWPVPPPINSLSDNIRGCQQHRLGVQSRDEACSWILDAGRSKSIDQLVRTEGGLPCPKNVSRTSELNNSDSNRQHNEFIVLYQQTGWNEVAIPFESSNRSMELVSPTEHYDSGTAYQRGSQHDCGYGVSPNIFQESMANTTVSLPTNQPTVGPLLNRSLCRPDDQIVTKVRVLASGSRGYPYGCVYLPMEDVGQAVHKSSMEPDHSSIEQDPTRETSPGDSGGAILAECSLVPSGTTVGSFCSLDTPSSSDTNDFSSNTPSTNTEELESIRVAIIRNKLEAQHLNPQATADLLRQQLAPNPTNKGYQKYQLQFIAWARSSEVSLTAFSGADVVNFLATLKQAHNYQVNTLKLARAAITHLHDRPSTVSADTLVNSYLATMSRLAPPVAIHRPTVDLLSPALEYARSIPSRPTTSAKKLLQKLAFLLAMAAFLRPSDLARIPYSSCSILGSGGLRFQVVAPKETRAKRRIIKPFTVHPHASDIELCPMECFRAVSSHPVRVNRPTSAQLFVNSNNSHQPLASSTISSCLHREFISLCTDEPGVTIRSLASCRALDLGVSRENIVALGNWASSNTFVNHYQRNQMANVDFTSTVLSGSVQNEFYDASDSFSLD